MVILKWFRIVYFLKTKDPENIRGSTFSTDTVLKAYQALYLLKTNDPESTLAIHFPMTIDFEIIPGNILSDNIGF